MTGAPSGWTGSSAPTAPAIGSPRDVCRPRTPRPSCAPGSTTFPPTAVEVLVQAPALAVRDRVGRWVEVTDVDRERCRLRMSTDSLDWAVTVLGLVGADFTVLSPPELLDHIEDWARRFGRSLRRRQ